MVDKKTRRTINRNIRRILGECFKALPLGDRKRLKWHLENKTPIFCGPGSRGDFFNESGFA